MDYQIELDVSAACYFYAMSPLLGISVLVNHVHFDSLQGDVAFLRILEKMGCTARDTPEGILVKLPADGVFHGVTVDMSACSDQAITLAAIAPYADATTTITGIGHIAYFLASTSATMRLKSLVNSFMFSGEAPKKLQGADCRSTSNIFCASMV